MKTILLLTAVVSVFYLRLPDSTHAQSFDNPNEYFKIMTFDAELRGTYNMSYCIKSKMNCWEVMKPDAYCRNNLIWPSVCDILNEYCTNIYDDLASYGSVMQVQENFCDWKGYYTK